jgi:hypothetical protein
MNKIPTVSEIVSKQNNTFSKASKLDKATAVNGIGQRLKCSNCRFSRWKHYRPT